MVPVNSDSGVRASRPFGSPCRSIWPIMVIGVRTICTKRERSPYAIAWLATPPGRGAPRP